MGCGYGYRYAQKYPQVTRAIAYEGGYIPGGYPCNMVPSGAVILLPCTLMVDTHNPPYKQRLIGMDSGAGILFVVCCLGAWMTIVYVVITISLP